MRYLNYVTASLASALVATYTALWIAHPAPLESTVRLPPLSVFEQPDDLLLWGGWRAVAGYEPPGTNAVETRCNRTQNTCIEAYASILQHDTGLDLVAEVFRYEIVFCSETRLEALRASWPDAIMRCTSILWGRARQ